MVKEFIVSELKESISVSSIQWMINRSTRLGSTPMLSVTGSQKLSFGAVRIGSECNMRLSRRSEVLNSRENNCP
jgi:hypothetical protein